MEQVKEKIFTSSKKLFEKYSPKKVSIDMIVEEAGVGKGTFYNYFKNKEDVYGAIIESFMKKKHSPKKMEKILSLDMEERLLTLFIFTSKMSLKNTIMTNIFLGNKNYFIGKYDGEYFEKMHFKKLQKVFADNVENLDVETVSNLIWIYLNDLFHKKTEFSEEDFEKYAIKLASIFVKGYMSDYEKLMKKLDMGEIDECSD